MAGLWRGRSRWSWWGPAVVVVVFLLYVALGPARLSGRETSTPGEQAASNNSEAGFRGLVLDPPQLAPDFALVDQYGRPFRLSEQKGKVVVLFFGYTSCPDVCPTTLVHFKQVRESLGNQARRVRFVFITVDPARDTRERLATYLRMYDPTLIGLWGQPSQLDKVYKDYGVYVEKVPAPNTSVEYWMNHTSLVYVIDTKGYLRLAHPFQKPVADLVADIQRLLP